MDAHPISPEIAMLEQYLKDRAIPTDPDFLKQAGFSFIAGNEITSLLGIPLVPSQLGIAMHYPGTDYTTVRLVGEPSSGPRCPKDKIPAAYFPHVVDWDRIDGTLVLTESPIKAITWAMMGYHAMSAGGTSTIWMGRKQLWCEGFPHESIEDGTIHTVLIAWDSDTEGLNRHVSGAVRSLSRALRERHHALDILIHVLPPPPATYHSDRWGCDDMRALIGDEAFAEYCRDTTVRRVPDADPLQSHLDELNEQYVFCRAPVRVIDLRTDTIFTQAEFISGIECSRKVTVDTDKGAKVVKVAPVWIEHVDRPTIQELSYSPGQDVIAGDTYNLWRPGSCVPRQGDVQPWLDLITDAIHDAQVRVLMLQCMAYQVQRRGTRLEKLLYFAGREQGTGKSTMAEIMARVLGQRNTGRPTKSSLEGQFNSSWLSKELAILDDIQKLKADSWSKLKTMITSDEVELTEKYLPSRIQKNHCVFYITANQADIITTDMDERRVLMIPFEPSSSHKDAHDTYWKGFFAWLDNGGVDFIAYYLMHLDLSDFDPCFHPPLTDAKRDAIESAVSDAESFLEDFRTDPHSFVPEGRVVITGHELFMLHTGEAPNPLNQKEFRLFIKKVRARMALERAVEGQYRITVIDKMSGQKAMKKVALFWVPGKRPAHEKYVNPVAARNNIKSFEIVL